MRKARSRIIWWGGYLLYVGLIYATLGVMPAVWDRLSVLAGGKLPAFQYLMYSALWAGALFFLIIIKKEKLLSGYIIFLLLFCAFCVMFRLARSLPEKMHMVEYGLAGAILYKALSIDIDRLNPRLYLSGALISIIAGSLDEFIQIYLPNRFFGWTDLSINALSGVMVFIFIRFNIITRE